MAAGQGLTVIKLGGSYALSPRLPAILAAIRSSVAPIVVVPGGGPFADAVRAAQPRMGFADRAAHRMALLAMAQFAEALAGLGDGFRVSPDLTAIRSALRDGFVAVWSPWPLADGLETLPESWNLTSDSLAAWLAGKLGASRLLLLKRRDPPDGGMSLAEMVETGVVDPLFPEYAQRFWSAAARPSVVIASAAKQSRITSAEQAATGLLRCARNDGKDLMPISAARWIGPAKLDGLAAILDGRAEDGGSLHPALPEPCSA